MGPGVHGCLLLGRGAKRRHPHSDAPRPWSHLEGSEHGSPSLIWRPWLASCPFTPADRGAQAGRDGCREQSPSLRGPQRPRCLDPGGTACRQRPTPPVRVALSGHPGPLATWPHSLVRKSAALALLPPSSEPLLPGSLPCLTLPPAAASRGRSELQAGTAVLASSPQPRGPRRLAQLSRGWGRSPADLGIPNCPCDSPEPMFADEEPLELTPGGGGGRREVTPAEGSTVMMGGGRGDLVTGTAGGAS